jgi:hypothetical protein
MLVNYHIRPCLSSLPCIGSSLSLLIGHMRQHILRDVSRDMQFLMGGGLVGFWAKKLSMRGFSVFNHFFGYFSFQLTEG